jgi:hypothetical protein
VKAPRQKLAMGKTSVLTAEEASELLRSIETDSVVGLRDRALIGMMVFTFAHLHGLRPGHGRHISPAAAAVDAAAREGRQVPRDARVRTLMRRAGRLERHQYSCVRVNPDCADLQFMDERWLAL